MIRELKNITIVGSGNIASFMGRLLQSKGLKICGIISRNAVSGQALADELKTAFSNELHIFPETDLLMLCVNDDEIKKLSDTIPPGDFTVSHCAGSLSLDVLGKHQLRAVIYPLQSINRYTEMQGLKIPFLIEANHEALGQQLENMLKATGRSYYHVNSQQRLAYHLAAVLVNNFTNAMLVAAEDFTKDQHIDFNLLKPLIQETVGRLEKHSPFEVQTGPAKRHDHETIQRHMALLSDRPEMQTLYRCVSEYISERFKDLH
jgi:predicted short-subunit dehydrogenase-like oxidoreductase (DUF2520 family)